MIWVTGLFLLRWNVFQIHLLFLTDMLLFVFFAFLRIICSYNPDEEDFFASFGARFLYGAITCFFTAFLLTALIAKSDPIATWLYILSWDDKWPLGIMAINYLGFFAHDFIYGEKYKTANPAVEGFSDYISVIVMSVVIGFAITLSGDIKMGSTYWFFSAIGVILGRFAMEIFLVNRTKFLLGKNVES